MLYPYMILSDGTEVLHTQMLDEGALIQRVEVHFERPVINGFKSARCSIPDCNWLYNNGYSEAELLLFEKLLKNNESQILKLAVRDERE